MSKKLTFKHYAYAFLTTASLATVGKEQFLTAKIGNAEIVGKTNTPTNVDAITPVKIRIMDGSFGWTYSFPSIREAVSYLARTLERARFTIEFADYRKVAKAVKKACEGVSDTELDVADKLLCDAFGFAEVRQVLASGEQLLIGSEMRFFPVGDSLAFRSDEFGVLKVKKMIKLISNKELSVKQQAPVNTSAASGFLDLCCTDPHIAKMTQLSKGSIMQTPYLNELQIIAEGNNLEAMYGALVTLRSIYQTDIPEDVNTVAVAMARKLRHNGWEVNLGLSNSSSGAWIIAP